MSQNYIKSLKVDEYTWQRIHFRGCMGRGPRHLAPVWHTPRHKMLQDLRWIFRTTVGMKLLWTTVYHIHTIISAPSASLCTPFHCYPLAAEWDSINVFYTAGIIAAIVLGVFLKTTKSKATQNKTQDGGRLQGISLLSGTCTQLLWS